MTNHRPIHAGIKFTRAISFLAIIGMFLAAFPMRLVQAKSFDPGIGLDFPVEPLVKLQTTASGEWVNPKSDLLNLRLSNNDYYTGQSNNFSTKLVELQPLATAISISGLHSCAINLDGYVYCWGWNQYGQLGDGTKINRNTPVQVLNQSETAVKISTGETHTCIITDLGSVKCWGSNSNGTIGDGTTIDQVSPTQVTSLTEGVQSLVSGMLHSCALTSSGGVKCWGANTYGQLGDGTTQTRLTPVDVIGLTSGVVAISAKAYETCAVTDSGALKCWGNNNYGQLGDGTIIDKLTPVNVAGLTSGVSSVSVGKFHACALTNAGGVKCWGLNSDGQLGDDTYTKRLTPVDTVGLSANAISISAGGAHTCAILVDEKTQCWGNNQVGQLGNGTTLGSILPIDVIDLVGVPAALSASGGSSCIIIEDGLVKCWGNNNEGQLGIGGDIQWIASPTYVVGFGATVPHFSISGSILDGMGNPISGVMISDGNGNNNSSDANGSYLLSDLEPGTYSLTATKSGFTFLPVTQTIAVVDADVSGVSFTGNLQENAKQWLLMYYLACDNNLSLESPSCLAYLNELKSYANQPNFNIAVMVDFSGFGGSQYYYISNGVVLYEQPEMNSGSPISLTNFIDWARDQAPTRYNALTIFDHGSQNGVAWDSSNGNDYISLKELGIAIHNASLVGGKIDLIFMKTCLTGNIEGSFELRYVVDYYVASEQIAWMYHPSSYYLRSITSSLQPEQLANLIAEDYHSNMVLLGVPHTISVAKLASIQVLSEKIDSLSTLLKDRMSGISSTLLRLKVLAEVQRFKTNDNCSLDDNDELIDLYDFARLIEQYSDDTDIQTAAHSLMSAVEEFIIYNEFRSGPIPMGHDCDDTSWNLENSHGVSAFFARPGMTRSFYNGESITFASGTLWGVSDELLENTDGISIAWGPMVAAYINTEYPDGADDPQPIDPYAPELLPRVVPSITGLSHSKGVVGLESLDLHVYGEGFVGDSVILWNGESRETEYLSDGELKTLLLPKDFEIENTAIITVYTAEPGGGISNDAPFEIINPYSTISTISPKYSMVDSTSFTVTVTGSNFFDTSILNWNEIPLLTTFINSTNLSAVVPAELVTEPDTNIMISVVSDFFDNEYFSNKLPFILIDHIPDFDQKLSSNKVSFDWDDIPDANLYTIQLSLYSNFSSTLLNTTTAASSYTFGTALTNGKTYYWRIRPRFGSTWSDWSPAWKFYSMNPPLAPVLASPVSGTLTNDNTPLLSWNAVVNGDYYQVQISKSSTFSILEQDQILDQGVLTYTTSTLPEGIHYWRVRGIDSVGVNGAWSAYRYFTVDTVPQAIPVMVSPANGAIQLTTIPKLTAKSVTGAKYYQFQVDDTEDFVDPSVDVMKTTYYYTLTSAQALPFGTAWWRVQSVDAAGNVSGWSTPRSFTVTILKTPLNNSYTTDTTPAFTWAAASGALEYYIQVDDSELFDSPEIDLNRPVSTSYTPLAALPYGLYHWRMQVRTASGWGNWTPVFTFTVTPALPLAPALKAPANAALTNDNTPTLEWNAAVNGVKYEIQISKLTSFSILEQNSVLDPGVLTYTAATLPDGKYYWRARSINYLDIPGAWSAYRYFTVDTVAPGLSTLSAPATGASVRGTPKYSWLAASGAKYYQFAYAGTSDFSDVIYTSGELTTLYLTPPHQELGTYYWHVRAKDVAGNWGGWSAYRQITIKPLVPVAPVLVSPTSGSSVSITTPTFNWNPVLDATTYEVQVDNSSTFSSPEATGNVTATWFTSGYLANGTYYWRVRAKNINDESGAWSAARSLKVNVPPTTTVVSISSAGAFGNYGAGSGELSENGRFVVFGSMSSNLVSGDTNETDDVFVHDQQTNVTSRVSISSTGAQGNASSGGGKSAISEDGRFVAFHSSADNLVPGDTNNFLDVFVRDRQTNQTTRISLSSSGTQGNERSVAPSISGDGRYVVFSSDASNLVSDDTNNVTDVFLHDRQTGQTTRISLSSSGTEGNGSSDSPSISGEGRFVTFISTATNLVSGDANGRLDIFVHDLITGNTSLISASSAGTQANGDSYSPSISRGGRYVAFESSATNLDDRDTTDEYDIYLHDMQTGATSLVSVTSTGEKGNNVSSGPEISANGLFVAYMSCATNLVSVDANGLCDIFVHDLLTGENSMASINSAGGQGDRDSYGPSISGDGRYVAFESDSWAFVSGDYLGWNDVFVHEFR